MNYFTKIAAYFSNELNDLERLVFEQELAENETLQAEVAAYEMAESLFGFTAETLPETEIVDTAATVTANELIAFTANNLSEAQILAPPVEAAQPTIVRQMKPRRNRMAWLAAASMLFIVSMIGLRFQKNQASWETLGHEGPVAVTAPEKNVVELIEKEVIPVIEEEKVNKVAAAPIVVKKKTKKYEPAKVKIVKKQRTNTRNLAANTTEISAKKSIENPLAYNTVGTKISSVKVIDRGQEVVYKADSGVILKEGFHAKAGSSFVATTLSDNKTSSNFTSAEKITGTNKVVYQANETITLKPGFHAKAGTDFLAKTASANTQEISTNTVVSDKESVVVKASNSVILKPGFHAKAGAVFTAKVAK